MGQSADHWRMGSRHHHKRGVVVLYVWDTILVSLGPHFLVLRSVGMRSHTGVVCT